MVEGQVSPREAPPGLGRAGSCVEMTRHTWASLAGSGLPLTPPGDRWPWAWENANNQSICWDTPTIPGEIHFALTHPGQLLHFTNSHLKRQCPNTPGEHTWRDGAGQVAPGGSEASCWARPGGSWGL